MPSFTHESFHPRSTARRHQRAIERLAAGLERAGVRIDGCKPWDLRLLDSAAAAHIVGHGNLGIGEAYMADWIEIDAIDVFIERVLRAGLDHSVRDRTGNRLAALEARLLNRQNPQRAWEVGRRHYDLGNDFYADMLDERMTYTCGYWKNASTLDEAQQAKLELIGRKLDLQPGQRVLDIGCGWGSFMGYAAEHFGVECVGATISREQAVFIEQRYAGLPVEARLIDYRELDERFDHIVSIGMFEHVGHRNFETFFDVARRCLKPEGLFLLHTIGNNVRTRRTDPWMNRYIFPNGEIPALSQITSALEGRFVVEDLHNFGVDYDRTLMAWAERFEQHWTRHRAHYGDSFGRMWRYYLLSCAGAFRARRLQLWQLVLSPEGLHGGYRRPE